MIGFRRNVHFLLEKFIQKALFTILTWYDKRLVRPTSVYVSHSSSFLVTNPQAKTNRHFPDTLGITLFHRNNKVILISALTRHLLPGKTPKKPRAERDARFYPSIIRTGYVSFPKATPKAFVAPSFPSSSTVLPVLPIIKWYKG